MLCRASIYRNATASPGVFRSYGSPQHYYHLLLWVIAPLLIKMGGNHAPGTRFYVLDDQPPNHLLEAIAAPLNATVVRSPAWEQLVEEEQEPACWLEPIYANQAGQKVRLWPFPTPDPHRPTRSL